MTISALPKLDYVEPRRPTSVDASLNPFIDSNLKVNNLFQVLSKSGKAKLVLSKEVGNLKKRVYAFWNKETYETYIGKTDQKIRKRIAAHIARVNQSSNDEASSRFYSALRKEPSKFCFAVLEEEDPMISSELSLLEQEIIEKIPQDKRLNMNKGGGGGTTQTANPSTPTKQPPVLLETPEKRYPIVVSCGQIKCLMSPKGASASNAIYSIKNKKTNKHYVGYTSQSLKKRVSQHLSKARKGISKVKGLPKALFQSPQDFQVGIYGKDIPKSFLPAIERKVIHLKKADTEGYNQNQGGGGSLSSLLD